MGPQAVLKHTSKQFLRAGSMAWHWGISWSWSWHEYLTSRKQRYMHNTVWLSVWHKMTRLRFELRRLAPLDILQRNARRFDLPTSLKANPLNHARAPCHSREHQQFPILVATQPKPKRCTSFDVFVEHGARARAASMQGASLLVAQSCCSVLSSISTSNVQESSLFKTPPARA